MTRSTMTLGCHFPFSICFTSLQNFFTSLQQLFTSLHHFFNFPSEFFFLLPFTIYFISLQSFLLLLFTIFCISLHHFYFFPLVFLLHFSVCKLILLSVSIFTSLPSLFTSLKSIYNSFYLHSVFFTTIQRLVIFLLLFSFLKLFLLSFGIFIVSFLIFKYRRKLDCNNFLLDKKFLKRISKAFLQGHRS